MSLTAEVRYAFAMPLDEQLTYLQALGERDGDSQVSLGVLLPLHWPFSAHTRFMHSSSGCKHCPFFIFKQYVHMWAAFRCHADCWHSPML